MSDYYVSGLEVYPIKSCGGIELEQAMVTPTGFEYDREFMLIDSANQFITQRRKGCEKLAKVALSLQDDHLLASIDGFGTQEIPLDYNPDGTRIETAVHAKPCVGLAVDKQSDAFFGGFLDIDDLRLIRASREEPRFIGLPYERADATNRVNFGDSFPFLLTSMASLRAQHQAAGMEDGAIPMNRFRPNIVIDGQELPAWAEDDWEMIQLGLVGAYVVRACDRCSIPSIVQKGDDAGQDSRQKVKAEFLRTRSGTDLANPDHPNGRFFGENIVPLEESVGVVIKKHDPIIILQTGVPKVRLKQAA